jgi:signal transduction histidine kinase
MLAAAFALACDGAGTARLADLRNVSAPWQGAPTRDGVPQMVSCLAVPVQTRSGEHLGALVLGHREANHFTEQHERIVTGMTAHAAVALENARLYQALRLREEEARARAEYEKQLVGIVSHDLKNPLGAIAMSASLLLKRGQLDEQQGKAIARIVSSTERANRLIGDFLDYTRARAGGVLPVNRAVCDIHRLAAQVIDEVHLAHPDREIAVSTEGSGWGEWDGDRIAQVISNLVANALQHSVPNSPIQIELSGAEDQVVFKIKNQGLVPAEILPNLFTPFQRGTDPSPRAEKSIGLGLYIAKRLVLAHGGTIDLVSTPDQGTTFEVRLPRGRVPPLDSAGLPPL